jgi:hypothetical protein
MGWGFELRPHASGGYPEDAVAKMQEYIQSWPVYQRSDKVWVLCDDYEHRDEVVRTGTIDFVRYGCDHIALLPHKVSLDVGRNVEHNLMLADFLMWSVERWPADFYDETDRRFTVAEFLKEMNPDQS